MNTDNGLHSGKNMSVCEELSLDAPHSAGGGSRQFARSEPQALPVPDTTPVTRSYDILLGLPDQLLAQSLEWAMSSQGRVSRVRSISDAEEVLSMVNAESPRVVILDESQAGLQLQSIARQIPVRLGDTALAVFADRLSCRQLHVASHYVSGMLSRQNSVQRFMLELDSIAAGRKVVSEPLSSRVIVNSRKRFEVASIEKIQNLTNRQLEVLVRIAVGMSAKEAAQDLHVTEKAIESHKYRVMRILGVRDRIELCRWAIREGIIET